jgi:hypothetical protein
VSIGEDAGDRRASSGGESAPRNKMSPAKTAFYLDVLDYFFNNDALHFRAYVIPDKSILRHEYYGQDHNIWYYKMMFGLLEPLLTPDNRYRIYLDKKDTRSAQRVEKLHEVLCNNLYDFDRSVIERVQVILSHHVEQVQLADLLIGAVGYVNRGLFANAAKNDFVKRMRERSRYSLTKTTLLREEKVNILIWKSRETIS